MSTSPIDDGSALVERVYRLLIESHLTRQRLITMAPADDAEEAERLLFLGLVSALEDGLRRTLEEAIATLKTMKGDEAEAWFRRR